MVRKTQRKYLKKAIKKNGVSFLAVALIAATSIAIYLGIRSGAVTILQQADCYFRENRLANLEITCATGISQEEVDILQEQSWVDTAEGGYTTMALMESEKEKIIVQVRSLLEYMNQAVVLEGELPKASDEVAIEEKFAREQNLAVGDEIRITHDGELTEKVFRVTAIINEPSFSCADVQDARGKSEEGYGSASYYMEVTKEAFSTTFYGNRYSVAYVENQELSDSYFYSDAYAELENALISNFDSEYFCQKDWTISGRNSMGDVSGVETIVEGLFTLSYSFAIIFLMVAVVVCYAAVVKMIDDQRILIGVQKALGFRTGEIVWHYLFYNILSAILGIIIGCVCSVIIVENLVLYVFRGEFLFDKIPLAFAWKEAGVVSALCLCIFVLATFAGCIKVVRQPAVSLLRGEVSSRKKAYFFESFGVYKKLNLYSRTMIKNVLGDKGRILTTIMGVVGCMSLLIITFTLKLSISNATDVQFKQYFLYENRLVIDTEKGNVSEYEALLEAEGISYRIIQDKLQYFRADGEDWKTVHVVVADSTQYLDDFIRLESVETKEMLEIPKNGVLVSRKCAELNDLKEGSVIEVMDAWGNAKECKIAGIMEHYLPYHQIVTSPEYYEEIFGEETDACVFLLKGSIDGLYEKVRADDGFMSLKDNSEYKNTLSSINLVIMICMAFSAVLAVLVLLNQMSMYINRKSKELSVMRINGYTIKATKNYVSKDNMFLVALGLALGCLIGTPMAIFEVCIMETGPNRYIRTANIPACILSVIICTIFAFIVNRIALRKIDKLSLTNVNGNG